MQLAGSYDAQVNAEPGQTAGDQIVVSGSGQLELGGTLKIAGAGRTDVSNYEVGALRTVVNNTAGGGIGDGIGGGLSFGDTDPASTSGKSSHVGQGAFLRDVIYRTAAPVGLTNIEGVDVELFIALGGDTDGSGEIWFDDWFNFRPNFAPDGTGNGWTEGDFDGDGKVWFDDWFIFRPNFAPDSYVVAEGQTVPEPGTPAMLLAGLIGLAVAVRRRRRA